MAEAVTLIKSVTKEKNSSTRIYWAALLLTKVKRKQDLHVFVLKQVLLKLYQISSQLDVILLDVTTNVIGLTNVSDGYGGSVAVFTPQ